VRILRERVAVITGGANGIGLSMARRFLAERMKVVIGDINQKELEQAVALLSSHGEVVGTQVDVANPTSVQSMAEFAVEQFGFVDVLCNNAGVGGLQRFETTSVEAWKWILDVNLWGVIHGCRIFLPLLKSRDEAHIINTASMAVFSCAAYHHPYNVSKAGVVALSVGLRKEFERNVPNVAVSVLCPGFTATSLNDDERNAPSGYLRRAQLDPSIDGLRRAVGRQLSNGRSADDVADLVLKGLLNKASYIFSDLPWLRSAGAEMARVVESYCAHTE
jgi:NAD(P)-dependent dehydrogenase (short-subunit alcohol dehydrogenase family)